jgi:hypothetical protein
MTMTAAGFERVLRVDLVGTFRCTRVVAERRRHDVAGACRWSRPVGRRSLPTEPLPACTGSGGRPEARRNEVTAMTIMRRWRVDVFVDEIDDTTTHAEARLYTNDDTRLVGHGRARRNPADAAVPEIGDEIAAGRALMDLARTLLGAAGADVEQVTHDPCRLDE